MFRKAARIPSVISLLYDVLTSSFTASSGSASLTTSVDRQETSASRLLASADTTSIVTTTVVHSLDLSNQVYLNSSSLLFKLPVKQFSLLSDESLTAAQKQ